MATVNDYTRTTWQTGDVIDATKMNNIETQLNAVTNNARENGVAPVFSTTKTYAVGEHVLYNGEVYRCKTAVTNAGAWVASNWVKASLSEDLEGEVSELKSALNAISAIPVGELTSGKYINRNDGTEGDDSHALCTGFLPIIPGMYVLIRGLYPTGVRGVALYKADYSYLGKPSGQAETFDFLVPGNAAYMRVTTKDTYTLEIYYDRLYEIYNTLNSTKLKANWGALNKGKFLLVGADGELILSESFKGAVNSSNPIDANQINENGWYSSTQNGKSYFSHIPSGTSGVITVYTTMKVGGGSSQANQICIDQSFNVWGRLLNTSNQTPITDWVQLVNTGTTPVGELQKSRWYGKTIKCFGDSRTWYNGHAYNERTKEEWAGRTCVGYQQTIADLTGATVTSDGHSGATSPTICEYIRAANLTGIDAVLLEGGVNDYIKADQVTIGSLAPIGSTFDTSTVYGAWQSAVEYILTNYPEVKIFMTVPAIAWDENGAMPYSTAEIKKNVAELYNIPCLDLYKNGGISQVNRDYYYVDDVSVTNWRLHFNDYGNALIGAEMAGFINTH